MPGAGVKNVFYLTAGPSGDGDPTRKRVVVSFSFKGSGAVDNSPLGVATLANIGVATVGATLFCALVSVPDGAGHASVNLDVTLKLAVRGTVPFAQSFGRIGSFNAIHVSLGGASVRPRTFWSGC